MNYKEYEKWSFNEQLDFLIKSNMISGKGAREINNAVILYPDKNPYEIANELGALYIELDIFKEYDNAQIFKSLYKDDIEKYHNEEIPKIKIIGLIMKFHKGGFNPLYIDDYINTYFPKPPVNTQ